MKKPLNCFFDESSSNGTKGSTFLVWFFINLLDSKLFEHQTYYFRKSVNLSKLIKITINLENNDTQKNDFIVGTLISTNFFIKSNLKTYWSTFTSCFAYT